MSDQIVKNIFLERHRSVEFRIVKVHEDVTVFEDSDFFYKAKLITADNHLADFECKVADAYAKVLSDLGLFWSVEYIEDESDIVRVEKRQKLRVIKPCDMTMEEVLIGAALVKRKVEKALEFPRISAQIAGKLSFKEYCRVTLARDKEFEFDDFAVFEDAVIPLGQSKVFIALVSQEGGWLDRVQNRVIPINIESGKYYFTRYETFVDDKALTIEKMGDCNQKWCIFTQTLGNILSVSNSLRKDLEQMYSDNVNILATKRASNVKISTDFISVRDECQGH